MRGIYHTYTDAELAALYNQQDRYAFEEIYRRYKDLLYIHAKRILHDQEQAQDVVQELFTTLLVKMGKLQLQSTINAYLYQTTQNRVLDYLRHQKVAFNYVESLQNFQPQYAKQADHRLLERELFQTMEEEINNLPPKMKAIVQMRLKQYLSNEEIALATNTSTENVRKQFREALKRIRARFTSFVCLQIITTILWYYRKY